MHHEFLTVNWNLIQTVTSQPTWCVSLHSERANCWFSALPPPPGQLAPLLTITENHCTVGSREGVASVFSPWLPLHCLPLSWEGTAVSQPGTSQWGWWDGSLFWRLKQTRQPPLWSRWPVSRRHCLCSLLLILTRILTRVSHKPCQSSGWPSPLTVGSD